MFMTWKTGHFQVVRIYELTLFLSKRKTLCKWMPPRKTEVRGMRREGGQPVKKPRGEALLLFFYCPSPLKGKLPVPNSDSSSSPLAASMLTCAWSPWSVTSKQISAFSTAYPCWRAFKVEVRERAKLRVWGEGGSKRESRVMKRRIQALLKIQRIEEKKKKAQPMDDCSFAV